MARKKLNIVYIPDDNARKATFKKRTKGIMKKVNELTILCGIQACAIIFSPFDYQSEVWPDPDGAKQVMERYQRTPVRDGNKNLNQERFTLRRIAKAQDQLDKQCMENREKEMTLTMFEYMQTRTLPENLTITDLKDIDKLIEKYMKEIETKMAALG